jgi:hypothetical protein
MIIKEKHPNKECTQLINKKSILERNTTKESWKIEGTHESAATLKHRGLHSVPSLCP